MRAGSRKICIRDQGNPYDSKPGNMPHTLCKPFNPYSVFYGFLFSGRFAGAAFGTEPETGLGIYTVLCCIYIYICIQYVYIYTHAYT